MARVSFRKGQWVTWRGREGFPGLHRTDAGRYVGIVVPDGTDSLGEAVVGCIRPVNRLGGDIRYHDDEGNERVLGFDPATLEDLQPCLDLNDIPEKRRAHIPADCVLLP